MNPAVYPPEAVPLQGGYDGRLGQPGGHSVVQHTTVNVTTEPPKDHIIWSLYSFVYSNCFCLGLAALIFSIKVSLIHEEFSVAAYQRIWNKKNVSQILHLKEQILQRRDRVRGKRFTD